ncbi:PIGN [Cordylochernes scorpioides]|uniref:GPI ethanolamine phosphate transferase 1 n=1 Tax=Cordylochernes scorpioides TaxID=51811 RepID=A0ABY6L5G9_9ARAC|nr:PIGN [Cordylochernes scorpioides]
MKKIGLRFILVGVIIHSILLFSIFDIYFKSPIIHGIEPVESAQPAPAKRIVIFVADGLRADKFYELENSKPRAPFLRNIILNNGAWGVSHTIMPSESRPGHVAMFSGFFEDVSAVTRGWKENPVHFDSVFNQSRYSWAWGSEDILPMFMKGISDQHMFIHCYSSELQEYGQADSSILDTWVFDQVDDFFKSASLNTTLKSMLEQDKIIFFLHLLATDVIGHSHKPFSSKYLNNIEVVDKQISKVVDTIENYYGHDSKTAYIFTSDHGMTDWGSHGAGSFEETLLPFVSWGAGIRRPLGSGRDRIDDGWDELWNLDQVKRVDVQQIDIAPLISTLIGTSIPVNSLGVLPLNYLNTPLTHCADALIANANQILKQYYHLKDSIQKKRLSFLYSPFKELAEHRKKEFFSMIETLQTQGRYKDAAQVTSKVIEIAIRGVQYYHKHDSVLLKMAASLCFLGWMAYVLSLIVYVHPKHKSLEEPFPVSGTSTLLRLYPLALLVILVLYLVNVQELPLMYNVYFLTPIFLWYAVFLKQDHYLKAYHYVVDNEGEFIFFGVCVLTLVGLEVLVMAFTSRKALCVGLWGLSLWPLLSGTMNTMLGKVWVGVTLALSVFPVLPVVGRESQYGLVCYGGWISTLIAILFLRWKLRRYIRTLEVIQVIGLACATCLVHFVSASLESSSRGMLMTGQFLSWCMLMVSPALPFLASTQLLQRLASISFALLTPYILLSIHYEVFFFLVLVIQLFTWLSSENSQHRNQPLDSLEFDNPASHSRKRYVTLADVRISYFYLFFIILAFFGTGNIASINSFEVSSVYCFVTVFSPFVMTALILLKVIFPFLLVACYFRAVIVARGASATSVFLLVLLMGDFMGIHFFFQVRDSGSWLDIGTSISHYVIIMTIVIFTTALYGIAVFYTSAVAWWCQALRSFNLKHS